MPVKIGLSQHIGGDISFRVLKWIKKQNDLVAEGEKLALIRDSLGDIQEVSVDHSGILACILIPEGPEDLHGKEIIAILALADDTKQDVAHAVSLCREFNRVSDEIFFKYASDNEGETDEEEAEVGDGQDYEDQSAVILDPEPVVTRRPSYRRTGGFLAGLIGGVATSTASRAVVGSGQPRIGNVIDRGRGIFEVYDERGNRTAQLNRYGAELRGYTPTQFHLKQAGRMLTFNVRGQVIGDRSA